MIVHSQVFRRARIFVFLASTFAAVPAGAWETIDGDTAFNGEELAELVVGRTLVYSAGSKSMFRDDGGYEFHVGGKVYEYKYEITHGGEVCISSPDYGARCDLIVRNGDEIISINDQGERYSAVIE